MLENEPVAEASEETPKEDFTKAKLWRLIGLLALSIAGSVCEQLFSETLADQRAFILGGMVIGLLLLVSWCRLDARERGYTIKKPLLLVIILFAFVGVPIYFIRTRGVRGILNIFLALLLVLALMALEQIAIEITFCLM